jgi:hypothetical protein
LVRVTKSALKAVEQSKRSIRDEAAQEFEKVEQDLEDVDD